MLEPREVAAEVLAGRRPFAALEVHVGDSCHRESTGGEAQLGAEGGALFGGGLPHRRVAFDERAHDVGAKVIAAEGERQQRHRDVVGEPPPRRLLEVEQRHQLRRRDGGGRRGRRSKSVLSMKRSPWIIPSGSSRVALAMQRRELGREDRHRRRELGARRRRGRHQREPAIDLVGLVASGAPIGEIVAGQVQARERGADLARVRRRHLGAHRACAPAARGTATRSSRARPARLRARRPAHERPAIERDRRRRRRHAVRGGVGDDGRLARDVVLRLAFVDAQETRAVVGIDRQIGVDGADRDRTVPAIGRRAEGAQDPRARRPPRVTEKNPYARPEKTT